MSDLGEAGGGNDRKSSADDAEDFLFNITQIRYALPTKAGITALFVTCSLQTWSCILTWLLCKHIAQGHLVVLTLGNFVCIHLTKQSYFCKVTLIAFLIR